MVLRELVFLEKNRWTASLGVDNIFNDQAYVSHSLSQRTVYAQIKFDY
jgi:iron complex outermembrane recepter protein